jgi:hypothetical protein
MGAGLDRLDGYRDGLRAAGLGAAAELVEGGDFSEESGAAAMARLLARDPAAAAELADGICRLLGRTRALRLAGLPLGDPVVRALARRRPDARVATARSLLLADRLDDAGPVVRSHDPRAVDRVLPDLLAAERDARARDLVRAAARLHAVLGQVEVATIETGGRLRAGLLTLVDGADRLPWWGRSEVGGLDTVRGAPLVGVTVSGRGRVLRPVLHRAARLVPAVPVSRRRGSG